MLFGRYVVAGKIRLDRTLADLKIDDLGGLLPSEREATVADLLAARSGVYHQASNIGDNLADAPPRGSQRHGKYFLYSNWDFNALGTIFEQETGQSIYDALERDLARPIGMQDFDRAKQPEWAMRPNPSISRTTWTFRRATWRGSATSCCVTVSGPGVSSRPEIGSAALSRR